MILKRQYSSGVSTLIRKLERFAPLSEECREALRMLPLRVQEFSRGEMVINQGQHSGESALVISGMLFRYKILPDGQRQIVALQLPGDFADLHSFVLNPLDHAIISASFTRLARVPHSALTQLLRQHPDLARWLMWDIALDAAISREWLAAHGRRSAYRHLAHLFCELYFRLSWTDQVVNHSFEFSLTQAELGDACGLSTVHVNRSIQELRKDGLIVLHNHQLMVPDITALMKAAQFDPAYLYGVGRVEKDAQVGS